MTARCARRILALATFHLFDMPVFGTSAAARARASCPAVCVPTDRSAIRLLMGISVSITLSAHGTAER